MLRNGGEGASYCQPPADPSSYDCRKQEFPWLLETLLIEGHTDNVPVAPGNRFRDNLELSSMRAATVHRMIAACEPGVERLLSTDDYPVLSTSGYGYTRPAIRDTGRTAENRRIDLRFLLEPPEGALAACRTGCPDRCPRTVWREGRHEGAFPEGIPGALGRRLLSSTARSSRREREKQPRWWRRTLAMSSRKNHRSTTCRLCIAESRKHGVDDRALSHGSNATRPAAIAVGAVLPGRTPADRLAGAKPAPRAGIWPLAVRWSPNAVGAGATPRVSSGLPRLTCRPSTTCAGCCGKPSRTAPLHLPLCRNGSNDAWIWGSSEKTATCRSYENWSRSTDPVDDILSQAGLEEGLARCGFPGVRHPQVPPERAASWLAQESLDDTQLARVLTFLECEGKLRFESVRVEIASALLSPFIDTSPPAATKDRLQSFFLRHLGDPRLQSGNWSGIDEEIRNVVTRWLVKESARWVHPADQGNGLSTDTGDTGRHSGWLASART